MSEVSTPPRRRGGGKRTNLLETASPAFSLPRVGSQSSLGREIGIKRGEDKGGGGEGGEVDGGEGDFWPLAPEVVLRAAEVGRQRSWPGPLHDSEWEYPGWEEVLHGVSSGRVQLDASLLVRDSRLAHELEVSLSDPGIPTTLRKLGEGLCSKVLDRTAQGMAYARVLGEYKVPEGVLESRIGGCALCRSECDRWLNLEDGAVYCGVIPGKDSALYALGAESGILRALECNVSEVSGEKSDLKGKGVSGGDGFERFFASFKSANVGEDDGDDAVVETPSVAARRVWCAGGKGEAKGHIGHAASFAKSEGIPFAAVRLGTLANPSSPQSSNATITVLTEKGWMWAKFSDVLARIGRWEEVIGGEGGRGAELDGGEVEHLYGEEIAARALRCAFDFSQPFRRNLSESSEHETDEERARRMRRKGGRKSLEVSSWRRVHVPFVSSAASGGRIAVVQALLATPIVTREAAGLWFRVLRSLSGSHLSTTTNPLDPMFQLGRLVALREELLVEDEKEEGVGRRSVEGEHICGAQAIPTRQGRTALCIDAFLAAVSSLSPGVPPSDPASALQEIASSSPALASLLTIRSTRIHEGSRSSGEDKKEVGMGAEEEKDDDEEGVERGEKSVTTLQAPVPVTLLREELRARQREVLRELGQERQAGRRRQRRGMSTDSPSRSESMVRSESLDFGDGTSSAPRRSSVSMSRGPTSASASAMRVQAALRGVSASLAAAVAPGAWEAMHQPMSVELSVCLAEWSKTHRMLRPPPVLAVAVDASKALKDALCHVGTEERTLLGDFGDRIDVVISRELQLRDGVWVTGADHGSVHSRGTGDANATYALVAIIGEPGRSSRKASDFEATCGMQSQEPRPAVSLRNVVHGGAGWEVIDSVDASVRHAEVPHSSKPKLVLYHRVDTPTPTSLPSPSSLHHEVRCLQAATTQEGVASMLKSISDRLVLDWSSYISPPTSQPHPSPALFRNAVWDPFSCWSSLATPFDPQGVVVPLTLPPPRDSTASPLLFPALDRRHAWLADRHFSLATTSTRASVSLLLRARFTHQRSTPSSYPSHPLFTSPIVPASTTTRSTATFSIPHHRPLVSSPIPSVPTPPSTTVSTPPRRRTRVGMPASTIPPPSTSSHIHSALFSTILPSTPAPPSPIVPTWSPFTSTVDRTLDKAGGWGGEGEEHNPESKHMLGHEERWPSSRHSSSSPPPLPPPKLPTLPSSSSTVSATSTVIEGSKTSVDLPQSVPKTIAMRHRAAITTGPPRAIPLAREVGGGGGEGDVMEEYWSDVEVDAYGGDGERGKKEEGVGRGGGVVVDSVARVEAEVEKLVRERAAAAGSVLKGALDDLTNAARIELLRAELLEAAIAKEEMLEASRDAEQARKRARELRAKLDEVKRTSKLLEMAGRETDAERAKREAMQRRGELEEVHGGPSVREAKQQAVAVEHAQSIRKRLLEVSGGASIPDAKQVFRRVAETNKVIGAAKKTSPALGEEAVFALVDLISNQLAQNCRYRPERATPEDKASAEALGVDSDSLDCELTFRAGLIVAQHAISVPSFWDIFRGHVFFNSPVASPSAPTWTLVDAPLGDPKRAQQLKLFALYCASLFWGDVGASDAAARLGGAPLAPKQAGPDALLFVEEAWVVVSTIMDEIPTLGAAAIPALEISLRFLGSRLHERYPDELRRLLAPLRPRAWARVALQKRCEALHSNTRYYTEKLRDLSEKVSKAAWAFPAGALIPADFEKT